MNPASIREHRLFVPLACYASVLAFAAYLFIYPWLLWTEQPEVVGRTGLSIVWVIITLPLQAFVAGFGTGSLKNRGWPVAIRWFKVALSITIVVVGSVVLYQATF